MKVLVINGSPRANGNTATALGQMTNIFEKHGVEYEIVQIGTMQIRGCQSCGYCYKNGKCAFDDVVNELAEKLRDADGFVIASPVYFAGPNGTLVACLDRLCYSARFDKTMKVGAAVAVARRGGTTATLDVLNKYLTYGGFAVATSKYGNIAHGKRPGEAIEDAEGMQTMRTLAENMVFLMKSIALGKEAYGLPEKETRVGTDFIRKA